MVFVDSPGICTIQPIFGESAEPIQNTFHYQLAEGITAAELLSLATCYLTWFTAHSGDFGAHIVVSKVYARSLETQTSPSLDLNPTDATDGTAPGAALANNVTFSLKRQSGLAGRKNRGRIYHPGLTASMCSGPNTMLPGFAADLVRDYNLLLAAMVSAGAENEVIYHKSDGTGTPVTSYAYADLNLDSQRRRLPGHNIHH